MPRITEIFFVDTPEQYALTVQSKVHESQIPETIGQSLLKLEEYFEGKNLIASDSPFLQVSGQDPEALDIMVGICIPRPNNGLGDVKGHLIPAGKKIFCYYQGDSAQILSVYQEMQDFAARKGYELDDGGFEYFLNGPEYGLDKLLTKVLVSLKNK